VDEWKAMLSAMIASCRFANAERKVHRKAPGTLHGHSSRAMIACRRSRDAARTIREREKLMSRL